MFSTSCRPSLPVVREDHDLYFIGKSTWQKYFEDEGKIRVLATTAMRISIYYCHGRTESLHSLVEAAFVFMPS